MEIREIKTTQVDEKCPLCGNKKDGGYMRPTGISVGSSHEHKCTNCDYKQSYPIRYPYIVNQ